MQYTIKPKNYLKQTIEKIHSKAEDFFLAAVLWIANVSKSEKLSNWIAKYTEKKIQKMQAEIIKMKWDKVTLDRAVSSIRNSQDTHH